MQNAFLCTSSLQYNEVCDDKKIIFFWQYNLSSDMKIKIYKNKVFNLLELLLQ